MAREAGAPGVAARKTVVRWRGDDGAALWWARDAPLPRSLWVASAAPASRATVATALARAVQDWRNGLVRAREDGRRPRRSSEWAPPPRSDAFLPFVDAATRVTDAGECTLPGDEWEDRAQVVGTDAAGEWTWDAYGWTPS